jgi:hypothetical protein
MSTVYLALISPVACSWVLGDVSRRFLDRSRIEFIIVSLIYVTLEWGLSVKVRVNVVYML